MERGIFITTSNHEIFSYEKACDVAFLLWYRHGRNYQAAVKAWRQAMNMDCEEQTLRQMVSDSQMS